MAIKNISIYQEKRYNNIRLLIHDKYIKKSHFKKKIVSRDLLMTWMFYVWVLYFFITSFVSPIITSSP
jgi:hypothetical protein